MSGVNMRILPIDIDTFIYRYEHIFEENNVSEIDEYYKYLLENKDKHHYDFRTMEEWYTLQVESYLGIEHEEEKIIEE